MGGGQVNTDKMKPIHACRWAKLLLVLMIVFNLLIFIVFKYLNFLIENINIILTINHITQLPQTNIHLPIGISFFTFQAMSYVFDVYYRKGNVQKNPLNTALYITLFPQLIAGPIVRYQTVADEIDHRKENLTDFNRGIQRFAIGLTKKVALSNTLAVAADYIFNTNLSKTMTTGMGWLGAVTYSMQILFDFSGYSDMAIGLGLMLGFHFPENFDYPYTSKTISEFWRRWHISLGTWFRDYVYIPLGGSHIKNKKRLIINLFVVWLLTGIWHGANWTFIIWGIFYFFLLTFEKLVGIKEKIRDSVIKVFFYRIFTLLCVMFGWVVFRSSNLKEAFTYISVMLGFSPAGIWNDTTSWLWKQYFVLLLISAIVCINWKSKFKFSKLISNIIFPVFTILTFLVSIAIIVNSPYDPFIYFNF